MGGPDDPEYVVARFRLAGPVLLAEADPAWPAVYAVEEARVIAALGDRVRGLEHVGSTSVPGLAAKPIIDISLEVADSADEAAFVGPRGATGYVLVLREPGWYEHRLLRRPDPAVNLHVFSYGCAEVERMLRFRELLRGGPTTATSMNAPSASWPRSPGPTSRTTPTPSRASSRRSSAAHEAELATGQEAGRHVVTWIRMATRLPRVTGHPDVAAAADDPHAAGSCAVWPVDPADVPAGSSLMGRQRVSR